MNVVHFMIDYTEQSSILQDPHFSIPFTPPFTSWYMQPASFLISPTLFITFISPPPPNPSTNPVVYTTTRSSTPFCNYQMLLIAFSQYNFICFDLHKTSSPLCLAGFLLNISLIKLMAAFLTPWDFLHKQPQENIKTLIYIILDCLIMAPFLCHVVENVSIFRNLKKSD